MIKRVLAVIVALSLFVCTAVISFSAPSTTVSYTYPSFYSVVLTVPSSGSWSAISSSTAVDSPLDSFYYSGSFTASYPSVNSDNGFDFVFRYQDYTFSSGSITRSVSFYPVSPVSVPVVLTFDCDSSSFVSNLSVRLYTGSSSDPPSYRFDMDSSDLSVISNGVHRYISFSIPYQFTPSVDYYLGLHFSSPSQSVTISNINISFPSALPSSSFFNASSSTYWQSQAISNYFGSSPNAILNTYYGFQMLGESINNHSSYLYVNFLNSFSPFLLQSTSYLSSLNSYFLSQSQKEEQSMKDAVPDGLPGKQDEAQKQLDDYENKEQQIFDNLDTSLDNLNLNQYQKFDTSIVSSMTFINKYVTKGFDGLGNFKIILFLPMVIGIGLSVIGRMGAMMSRVSVRSSMTSSQIRRNARNYTSNGRTTRRR